MIFWAALRGHLVAGRLLTYSGRPRKQKILALHGLGEHDEKAQPQRFVVHRVRPIFAAAAVNDDAALERLALARRGRAHTGVRERTAHAGPEASPPLEGHERLPGLREDQEVSFGCSLPPALLS